MTKGRKKKEPEGASRNVLDWATGRIGKIGALLAAVAVVIGSAETILDFFPSSSPPDLAGCFDGKLSPEPSSVPFNQWSNVKFTLEGKNKCGKSLVVHVAFQAKSGPVVIGPPYGGAECSRNALLNSVCWHKVQLPDPSFFFASDVKTDVVAPNIERLGKLDTPVAVDINWTAYEAQKQVQVGAGSSSIEIK